MFDFSDGLSRSIREFRQLLPPKHYSWADPHVVLENGLYYIFFEEFTRNTKGHISLMVMDEAGNCSKPEPVLNAPIICPTHSYSSGMATTI